MSRRTGPAEGDREREGEVRLDAFLHKARLLRSRTLAKEACDRGKVTVNGEAAKAARPVRPGERIRMDLGLRMIEVEVGAVPAGQVSRQQARDLIRVLEDRRLGP